MTTKTRKLTIKALRTRSPWEIASELGLRYSGDMNPIPHGGYFYNTHKGWGDFPEFRIMQAARGLILGLCE